MNYMMELQPLSAYHGWSLFPTLRNWVDYLDDSISAEYFELGEEVPHEG